MLRTKFQVNELLKGSDQKVIFLSKGRIKNEISKTIHKPGQSSMSLSSKDDKEMMSNTDELQKSINRMKKLNRQLIKVPKKPDGLSPVSPTAQNQFNKESKNDNFEQSVIHEMPGEEESSISDLEAMMDS